MATTRGQRIGIWVIIVFLVAGTLGGFVAMVLTPRNQEADQARLRELTVQYQAQLNDHQKKLAERDKALSDKYYPIFKQYTDGRPSVFGADSVDKLASEDIVTGDGATIDGSSKFAVYYMLWLPDGTVKESSIKDGGLTSPLPVDNGLDQAALITGWKQGIPGMKVGGVRQLTIPANQAYGEQGSQDAQGKVSIPPNTPLRFVVMAVPPVEAIAQPELPTELRRLYSQQIR